MAEWYQSDEGQYELATVLPALRHWQQDLAANDDEGPISSEHFDDQVTPLLVE